MLAGTQIKQSVQAHTLLVQLLVPLPYITLLLVATS